MRYSVGLFVIFWSSLGFAQQTFQEVYNRSCHTSTWGDFWDIQCPGSGECPRVRNNLDKQYWNIELASTDKTLSVFEEEGFGTIEPIQGNPQPTGTEFQPFWGLARPNGYKIIGRYGIFPTSTAEAFGLYFNVSQSTSAFKSTYFEARIVVQISSRITGSIAVKEFKKTYRYRETLVRPVAWQIYERHLTSGVPKDLKGSSHRNDPQVPLVDRTCSGTEGPPPRVSASSLEVRLYCADRKPPLTVNNVGCYCEAREESLAPPKENCFATHISGNACVFACP